MNNDPLFEYDKETGLTTCILTDGDNVFIGMAQCHPEDQDMMSEKTGCEIALKRALIKSMQHYKNNIIRPSLNTLNHLYSTVNHSKNFDNYNPVMKNLKRQIRQTENDLTTIKEMIAMEKEKLYSYINSKEEFYQRIRANRKKD